LKLPPWLEGQRDQIERELHPVTTPQWHPVEAR